MGVLRSVGGYMCDGVWVGICVMGVLRFDGVCGYICDGCVKV